MPISRIAGAVFGNGLTSYLPVYAPDISAEQAAAVSQSVTAIFTLPANLQSGVVEAYVKSVDRVFLIGVPVGALASASSW